MIRFAVAATAVALCTLPAIGPAAAPAVDTRALPMQFEFWTEGPTDACGTKCRSWVSATGAITSDTPRDFEAFAKKRKLAGVAIALDSDGGSVLGALSLGRAIRKLGMTTTVGKSVDLAAGEGGERRGRLMPRAYCESMCAFVLLAGVERHVPAAARVLVHQIWLGDRRDDPTAANYSAEDLVLVQRDIGRLAQYTVEMGGSIDLLEIALKIPPWEPMRLLSRDELRGMKLVTAAEEATEASSNTSTSASQVLSNGARAPINGRNWTMVASAERPMLTRKHPLTIEGEDIGTFELGFACGETPKEYAVSYTEQRRAGDNGRLPKVLTDVEISLSGKSVPLKLVSSRQNGASPEIESVANGRLSAELFKVFTESNGRSLTVETTSDDASTAIRIGNAGAARGLQQLIATCAGRARTRSTARADSRPGG
jgi:hypothetical protein